MNIIAQTNPELKWYSLPDGTIEHLSADWLAHFDLPHQDAVGHGWSVIVHPDDLEALSAEWKRACRTKSPYEAIARLRIYTGEYRTFLCKATPELDENGNIVRWRGKNVESAGDNFKKTQDAFDHVHPTAESMGASSENWFPLTRLGEQAKARARTARASTQSLAEQFAGSIVGEILYARLFCGLRFFDKNHKITREFPPCAVKQVCSIIATAKSQGRTTEEVLPEEIKLAANGLEKLLNAGPHALCLSCPNRFCPIKKKIAQAGSSAFKRTQGPKLE